MPSSIRWCSTIAATFPLWLLGCRAAPPIEAAFDDASEAANAAPTDEPEIGPDTTVGRGVAPSPPAPPTDEELAAELPPDFAPDGGEPGVHWMGVACEPTKRARFHVEANPRFGFCLDVPDGWHAEEQSANGDGFVVVGPAASVDVRAWGGWFLLSRAEEIEMRRGHGVVSDFRFSDGSLGKAFQEGRQHSWIRLEDDRVIGFAVTADDAWLKAHERQILAMARSLRMGRQFSREHPPKARPAAPGTDATPM